VKVSEEFFSVILSLSLSFSLFFPYFSSSLPPEKKKRKREREGKKILADCILTQLSELWV